MPKIKTNRAAAKRFKRTGKGKIVRSQAYAQHKFTCKSAKRKRNLRQAALVDASNEKGLRRLLPYL